MKSKKLITTILAAARLLGDTAFAAEMYATRGEVVDMLLLAAGDGMYVPEDERVKIW